MLYKLILFKDDYFISCILIGLKRYATMTKHNFCPSFTVADFFSVSKIGVLKIASSLVNFFMSG